MSVVFVRKLSFKSFYFFQELFQNKTVVKDTVLSQWKSITSVYKSLKLLNVYSRKLYCQFFQMLNVMNSSKIYLKWLNCDKSTIGNPITHITLLFKPPHTPILLSGLSNKKEGKQKKHRAATTALVSLEIYYLKLDDLIFFPMFHIVVCR